MSYFKFDYVEESELEIKSAPLVEGEARFKVAAIYEETKDGKPLTTMDGTSKVTLGLSVKDKVGNSGFVYDDLTAKTAWKIKALLDALGLGALYNKNAQLDLNNIMNCEGRCEIAIKSYNGKDRLQISKYIKSDNQIAFKNSEPSMDLEDTIPF